MTTRIGPLGQLLEVDAPAPIEVVVGRIVSELKLLSGGRVAQRAPMAARTWQWNLLGYLAGLENLAALERGAFGDGPFWWYDETMLAFNMLPAEGSFANKLLVGGGVTALGPTSIPGGRTLPMSLGLGEELALHDLAPVLPGVSYVAEVFSSFAPLVTLLWLDSDGVPQWSDTGTGTVVAEAPPDVAAVRMTVQSGWFGAARLTPGTVPSGEWLVGEGVPKVSLSGASESLRLMRADPSHSLRRMSVLLVEVV